MQNDLASLLTSKGIERKVVVLMILASSDTLLMPKDIKIIGGKHGMQKIKKWNISQLLSDLGECVARYEDGWAATQQGKIKLSELGLSKSAPTKKPQIKLREYLSNIPDEKTNQFVSEAVQALEYGLLRSAVVLSWVGAISILHQQIVTNYLQPFNQELLKRNSKNKMIRKVEDLELVKEYDFLQISRAVGLIGKNVKDELEVCLKLRNGCGHPNSLKIGEHRVASHIETLLLNVYGPFTKN